MNVLWFLPILSIMMFVHELGHFITARMSGITVLEFGFGLPPRLLGCERKGVIYSINCIAFAAFVRMFCVWVPAVPGSFASKPGCIRAAVRGAGSAMNFFLAVLAFSLVYMVGLPGVSPQDPVRISAVSPDCPATQVGLQ